MKLTNERLTYEINCDENEYASLLAEAKRRVCEFDVDFGKIPDFPDEYGMPKIIPTKGEHPRLWVKKDDIAKIVENIGSEENQSNYKKVMNKADIRFDGVLPTPSEHTYNYSPEYLAKIESLAFMYLITEDELYGYTALLSAKNYLNTIIITDEFHDKAYYAGASMFVISEVYDWCYHLMSERDKTQLADGMINVLGTLFEMGVPPSGQGAVCGHGTGSQLLRDWISYSVATYDERPEVYINVLGRFYRDFIGAPNFYYKSGTNFHGSAYGAGKTSINLISELIMHKISGEYLYDFSFKPIADTYINYVRPDNQALRIGDDYNQRSIDGYNLNRYGMIAFFCSSLYEDPTYKAWAKFFTNDFDKLEWSGMLLMTPVTFLILNKPWVKDGRRFDAPKFVYNGSPTGAIVARADWNDDAWMTYTKIGEAYGANHEHKDAGSFQIYYKGILAMTSSCYEYFGRENYGSLLDFAYNKQTISKNCLLIYNKDLPWPTSKWDLKWLNSGGQRFRGDANSEKPTLEAWLDSKASHQAKIMAHEIKADENGSPTFAYIEGDITNAYDEETASLVTRATMTVATDDPRHPMVFAVYDRLASVDPTYRKKFLLHMPEEPTVNGNVTVITNTKGECNGKLVNTTLLPKEIKTEIIGGDGKRFFVNGENLAKEEKENYYNEIGWGRVEISPALDNIEDSFLNVSYVTDADRVEQTYEPDLIECETHDGAELFGRALLFSKTKERVSSSVSFSLSKAALCFVSGLKGGVWKISNSGEKTTQYTVTDESGVASFYANAGDVNLEFCK